MRTAARYGLLSGLQRISFRGREPWCGSMDRCTKGVDLIFLADLSEPDAAAGRTDYDTDMGIWRIKGFYAYRNFSMKAGMGNGWHMLIPYGY